MRLEYLGLMAACILVTLPLEFVLGARVYRRPLRMMVAIVPVAVIFSIWDIVAIARGWWSYDGRFVTGIDLPFGLPLEELVFFIVIPLCALLTFEAVGRILRRVRRRARHGAPDA